MALRGELAGLLPSSLSAEAFEVPISANDQHGNPVRLGADPKTGWALEIRHKATGTHFVFIAPGEFMMGSPAGENGRGKDETQHHVRLTKPFYLGKYEATRGEWKKIMESEPSQGETYAKENPSHAVSDVSWDDCQRLVKKMNERLRGTRNALRLALPTEAQWEYACRAGTETAYCFGGDTSKLGDYAWFGENVDDQGDRHAHPVGRKKPNAWGLYDMHGNVWEWCQDRYGTYAEGGPSDPTGATSGEYRVFRGGSWRYTPRF